MDEFYKRNDYFKKEKKKVSCRSVYIVWNYLYLVLEIWKDCDIFCLGMYLDGVKI